MSEGNGQKTAGRGVFNRFYHWMVSNTSLLRDRTRKTLFDPRRDIDEEAGYPDTISLDELRQLFDRTGIARRVVSLFPDESWSVEPTITDNDEDEESEFVQSWNDLADRFNFLEFLNRVDTLSGVGHCGIILLGLSDGKDLREPVGEVDERGNFVSEQDLDLLFLRVFDEQHAQIQSFEQDPKNPRFGQPIFYDVSFSDPSNTNSPSQSFEGGREQVHWSRVIHIADNRESSEVLGVPRLSPVFNHVMDFRKILAGSAEMFWKGGFPGLSVEVNPDIVDPEIDQDSVKEELQAYQNSMQRIIAMAGLSVKTLDPNMADPLNHLKIQIETIASTIGVPMRKLVGTERGELASTQDERTWAERIKKRQNRYLTPLVLRPFIDRLIAFGIMPEPQEGRYKVSWPDLRTQSDEEKAKVGQSMADAVAKYMKSGGHRLISPVKFLTVFLGIPPKTAEAAVEEAKRLLEEGENDQLGQQGSGTESGEGDGTGVPGQGTKAERSETSPPSSPTESP